jgi:septal ring factor EnvC (AmiA/AmiB activator)
VIVNHALFAFAFFSRRQDRGKANCFSGSQKNGNLESPVAQQQKERQALTASLKEQAALIQKVSAQIEARKPAPQVVNNP